MRKVHTSDPCASLHRAGAEKITTVEEAADVIFQKVESK